MVPIAAQLVCAWRTTFKSMAVCSEGGYRRQTRWQILVCATPLFRQAAKYIGLEFLASRRCQVSGRSCVSIDRAVVTRCRICPRILCHFDCDGLYSASSVWVIRQLETDRVFGIVSRYPRGQRVYVFSPSSGSELYECQHGRSTHPRDTGYEEANENKCLIASWMQMHLGYSRGQASW